LPAKPNVGMARSTQLCEPATSAEGSFWSEKLPSRRPSIPESASAKTIGMESATRTAKVTTTAATMDRPVSQEGEPHGRRPLQTPRGPPMKVSQVSDHAPTSSTQKKRTVGRSKVAEIQVIT